MEYQHNINVSRFINQSARLLAALGDGRLRNLGFRFAQVPILAALRDGERLTQAELVRRMNVEQSSMAQLLARMERDGIIERVPDESNKRISLISVTAQASAHLPAARQQLVELEMEALSGLNANEVATLVDLLAKVHANLERVAAHSKKR